MNEYRMPPADVEAEQQVIGAIMLDAEALGMAMSLLTPEDFYLERHQVLFQAAQSLSAKGGHADPLAMEDALIRAGRLEVAGGKLYLVEILQEVVSWVNLDRHCKVLREKSTLRKLIRVASGILERAYDPSQGAQEVLESAEAGVTTISDSASVVPGLKSMSSVIRVAAEEWEAVAKGQVAGVMTSIPPLDDILMGLRPGKFYILAARPGLGKSMLALQIASRCGATVPIFSLEMLATEQVERMVSQESDLNSESLRSPAVIAAKAKMLHAAVTKLKGLPIWFCDQPPITPLYILSESRRLQKRHGLGLIIVDYLQLIQGVGKFERRDLEIASISAFLKGIAMKLNVPVLSIASLSRKPEERQDKRPIPSDLRESGNIESDADGIIFLYRESDYNARARALFPNTTEIIVAKNRGGRKGRAIVEFDGAHSLFYPMTPDSVRGYLEFLNPSKNKGNTHDNEKPSGQHPRKVSNPSANWWNGGE